jgi:putative ATPase
MKQINFFENSANQRNKPLAARMSPQNFKEFVGQDGIVGDGKLLRRLIETDNLRSVIFFGPPGTGKSALARIIASKTKSYFEEANAVTTSIANIRKIIDSAKSRAEMSGEKTILMLDEIHHFNRSQQDALLPDVEKGVITLIGITTRNPFFYINAAIISRSTVFEFQPLSKKALLSIMELALQNKEKGLGNYKVKMSDGARKHLIINAGGDARKVLNALEIGVLSTRVNDEGVRNFDIVVAQESMQKKTVLYDRSGDAHYDHISAFIKSMRGTDPDATIYWMSKMFVAGEEPRFIARRIIICASEDVGTADPMALMLAVSAFNAIEFVGMPEAKIILAQAAIYVACAPKSNASYLAVEKAMLEIKNGAVRNVPNHLKNVNLDGKELGQGQNYKYPHNFEGNYVEQEYWTDPVEFYIPTKEGCEEKIRERLLRIKKRKIRNEFLTLRNKLGSVLAVNLSARIFTAVEILIMYQKAKTVMFYLSCGSEVATDVMLESAFKEGKIVVVPAISNPEDLQMQAVKISKLEDACQLVSGIRQPEINAENIVKKDDIDLVFVPAIAFDILGYRIGYGKGYYDRWLEGVPANKTVGLAYDFQITDKLPIGKYDLLVGKIITEKRIIQIIKN